MQYELINPINPNYSPLEQVLVNRGIQYEDIPHYLNLGEEDELSPSLLANIDDAVKLLVKHLGKEDRHIHIQVDSDCDGYTSSAFLLNYLYDVYPSCLSKISYSFHSGKIHGINPALVPNGTTLVIAPDSSSNDYDIHKELHEKGIDVLVIDHHLAEMISPDATVVNNQLCDYPNKTLSGVGVVYKVCERMDEILGELHAEKFIDLVMLGLVADMMDIRNQETRYLIKKGMENVSNPFIVGMTQKNEYSLKGQLTPIGVAFYIVPLVNSITRVGTYEEKELLFKSMLPWEASQLVPSTKRGCKGQMETLLEQALRTCTNVKNRQTKTRDAGVEEIYAIIERDRLLDNKLLIVKLAAGALDPGVTGLIANELMSEFQRPVLILSETTHEGKKAWAGSARGYEKSQLTDFRQFCRDSGFFYLCEGHANAWGAGILDENIYDFIRWSNDKLKDIEFSPSYRVDFIYPANTARPQTILDLGDHHELWGQNMEEPLIAIENAKVSKEMITLMSRDKNPTLKIMLPTGIACIKFRSSEEEYQNLCSENGCVVLNIIGRPEVNHYYNTITPQLLITDYEVIDRQEYFF